MAVFNLWSLGHFVQWSLVGRFILTNWYVFLFLSIGWEFVELVLPYEFAKETIDNKISDVIVNITGFWIGNRIRIDPMLASRTS
ncbi:MAG: hypothetical protein VXY42_00240 [Candidatus Thermoplasmatota archaeon]|nr:hypothetical protein [Candidatus Thermoplasmatota archaeon]